MRPSSYAGILLASLGVLMSEILLTRIFSFTVWYHLAYLTISTALLGFGAAGTLLALRPALLERDPARVASRAAALAALALIGAAALLGPHPIDPERLIAEPIAFSAGLLAYYAVVAVPFLFAGIAIATPLSAWPERADRLYAADLLGAGLGCAAAVLALSLLDAAGALCAAAAALAASAACYALPGGRALVPCLLTLALLAAAPFAGRVIEFRPAASKGLAVAWDLPGGILFSRWSPVNRVDLHRHATAQAGFWSGIGVGKTYHGPHPRALSIQYDGHNGSDVLEVRGPDSLAFLDSHLLRTPYLLKSAPRVLVIGVGGGIDVLNALRRGAVHVTGAELQPITLELHRGLLAPWTGGQLQRPEVELHAAEGRHFVRSHDERYDLIQITATDTFSAQSTGAYVLAESYLYTVQAFEDYLAHLAPDGLISVVLGDHFFEAPELPMPLATRLALTALSALERRGVEHPERHLLVNAQFLATDLLVKSTPFTPEEVARVAAFADENGFYLPYEPGRDGSGALAALLNARPEERARRLAENPFSVEPLDDDRPFFFHILRWKSLFGGEEALWYSPGSATGMWVLVILLAQAIVVGSALIAAPLALRGRAGLPRRDTAGFLAYFCALGLGFLLIEISFVQKYVLLLGYPTYSLSVTLFSLLVFAAAGAATSRRWRDAVPRFLLALLAATALLVLAEIALLPVLRERLLGAPLALRIAATAAMQLPLGFCLGMYFPTGLELLRRRAPALVPWAWAVNGVASVASAVLAVLLAMAIGFTGVALVAVAIYAVGVLALLRVLRRPSAT
jgi:hypothetical protein